MSDGTVVQAQGLRGHDAHGALTGLDLSLPAGTVGCLVGGRSDGTCVLARVLAGSERPSHGHLIVGGLPPWWSASTRARIGALLDKPELADVGTVRELLALARRLRGDSPERESWFEAIGASSLLRRPIDGLDRREVRTVALALALSAPAPLLVVLHEPLADVVKADATVLREVLRRRASEGACVLVLTASAADAAALADDVATLKQGRVDRAIGAPDTDELVPGADIELRVWTDKPRQVAAALAGEASVTALSFSASDDAVPVAVRSKELAASAKAVARVCLECGAELRAMQAVAPGGRAMHDAGGTSPRKAAP